MGSGASTVGVPANPRVQYSKQLEKTEKKKILVDAPVLVDVEHGSVRYRQAGNTTLGKQLKDKECPYQTEKGQDLQSKNHYFYHTRLSKYGPDSRKENEDAFKFYYVTKGPRSAEEKKIFYVYGQGWEAKDGQKVKPSDTVGEGKDFAWSSKHQPNGLYYLLEFDETVPPEDTGDEDKLLADLESTPDKTCIRLTVASDERVANVKARTAVKLLKLTNYIHIAYGSKELRDEDVVAALRPKPETQSGEGEEPSNVNIILKLI